MTTQEKETGEGIKSRVSPVKDDVATPREKYFWVKFQAKSDPTHKDDVELAVNGETLVLQREKKIALPARFLECADNARYVKFEQKPGQNRKVVAHIRMFPYDLLGPAKKQDFFNQKAAGTKLVKDVMEKGE